MIDQGPALQPSLPRDARWCQPGDRQDQRKYLVRFEDPDRGDAVFDDAREAADFYARATLSWTCWLFSAVSVEDLTAVLANHHWPIDETRLQAGPSEWLPIASAPVDGTKIDVWCEHPGGGCGVRFTDVQMRGDGSGWGVVHHYPDASGEVRAHWEYLERAEGIFPIWKIVAWRRRPGPPAMRLDGGVRRLSPLSFVFDRDRDEHRADTPVGLFSIREVQGGWTAWFGKNRIDRTIHARQAEAQAACDDHFERTLAPFFA